MAKLSRPAKLLKKIFDANPEASEEENIRRFSEIVAKDKTLGEEVRKEGAKMMVADMIEQFKQRQAAPTNDPSPTRNYTAWGWQRAQS